MLLNERDNCSDKIDDAFHLLKRAAMLPDPPVRRTLLLSHPFIRLSFPSCSYKRNTFSLGIRFSFRF